ncbi:MAG: aminoacyl-tRNA hydrolase [Bacteroidia bacterium]
MKFLYVGLGNPGAEYDATRHNIGFAVLDELAEKLGGEWQSVRHGHMAVVSHKGRKLHLLKPNTYMNLSGKAVAYHMQQEKMPLENIVVITDDIALPTGKLRLKEKGSDGGHNGLKSINASLNTPNYARLRFGVGNDFAKGRQAEYVLGLFKDEEQEAIADAIKRSIQGLLSYCTQGPGHTMTQVNAQK